MPQYETRRDGSNFALNHTILINKLKTIKIILFYTFKIVGMGKLDGVVSTLIFCFLFLEWIYARCVEEKWERKLYPTIK